MRLAVALLLVSRAAAADDTHAAVIDPDLDEGLANKLGFHLGGGDLPLGVPQNTTVIGLELERPLLGRLRGFVDYSYVRTVEDDVAATRVSQLGGDGDRLSTGLRLAVIGRTWLHLIRLAVDVELGGGVQWTDDPLTRGASQPFGFVGLRGSWGLLGFEASSETLILEPSLAVRAVAIDGGAGVEVAFGWSFGN